ncbi:MAG: hypothetical protein WC460_00780 [Patescibacteria group bacterium]
MADKNPSDKDVQIWAAHVMTGETNICLKCGKPAAIKIPNKVAVTCTECNFSWDCNSPGEKITKK